MPQKYNFIEGVSKRALYGSKLTYRKNADNGDKSRELGLFMHKRERGQS